MNDAHLHLQDHRLEDIDSIVSEMMDAGVKRCVVNGTQPSDWQRVYELAQSYQEFIIPSYGLHPWHTSLVEESWMVELATYVSEAKLHCVGECGLDRWMKDPDIQGQERAFLYQLELATSYDSPLSIHILKAWGWFMDLLRKHRFPARGFLLHSYNGSAEMIDELVDHGAYFSFSGYYLQSRKQKQLGIFKKIPLDRLLIETDAPDMLPPPDVITHRVSGSTELNHPANLRSISQHLARHLEIGTNDFARLLEANFTRFF